MDNWHATAFNQAPDSANQIHGDEIAQQYGFEGGLVPGVTISAYLCHPGVVAWGEEFLSRGRAHVKVGKPLYDNEPFDVIVDSASDEAYDAKLIRAGGIVSAEARIELTTALPEPPTRRGDPVESKDHVPPESSVETFARLKQDGCVAFHYKWSPRHNMSTYLGDPAQMPAIHRFENGDGLANMAFLLGCSNWVLASNAHMNPWVHLETTSQNFKPVTSETLLVAEMAVVDTFKRKGHEFVDVIVNLFDESDSCVCQIELRAIYRLRGL